jgi:hypothetical protein
VVRKSRTGTSSSVARTKKSVSPKVGLGLTLGLDASARHPLYQSMLVIADTLQSTFSLLVNDQPLLSGINLRKMTFLSF